MKQNKKEKKNKNHVKGMLSTTKLDRFEIE